MQLRRSIAILLLLTVILNLWPQVPVQAANIIDPRDLGSLYKGQPITRIDPASGSDTVLFHDYWTVIVDNQLAGEDLVAAEPTQTSGAYNYIAWSKLSEWVGVFKGSQVFAERETSKTYLYANNKSSTRVHIRSLTRACGATVSNWDPTQRKVWVITTPWPYGKIPDIPGLIAGQTKSFWVDAYASTVDTRGLTYSFIINGKQVIGSTKVSSNYAGFCVTYNFPAPGTYTLRLEVTDTVGRTTPVTKTITVAPAPQPPQLPSLPPSPGQPVADFDLPSLGEVGENIQVVNKSRVSSGFWLVNSQWTVTPQTYSGNLGMQGGTLLFNQPGVYTVKLKVWDNQNNTSTATKSISISDKSPPPEPPVPPEIDFSDFEQVINHYMEQFGAARNQIIKAMISVQGQLDKGAIIMDYKAYFEKTLTQVMQEDDFRKHFV